MIFGPATDGYPIVNYEYAIVPTKQPSAAGGPGDEGRSGVGHRPERGQRIDLSQPGQLRGTAEPGGVDLHQAHRQGRQLAPAGRGPRAVSDVRTVAHHGGGRRGCRGREEGPR